MKKAFLLVIILLLAGFGIYWFVFRKKENPADKGPKQQPLAVGANTSAFNESYSKLLTTYYAVKDALVAADTAKATTAAMQLATDADSLQISQIQGDTSGAIKETAQIYAGTISGSAKALAGEAGIEGKRKEFEMIADALWTLTRTVKYSGEKLYWQYCPMAFNNKGAYWVSNDPAIKNPYFGNKMLTCGSSEDSLDYSGK